MLSHLFGPSRLFSGSIPQAQLSSFDWSTLLFRSNEQRADWLLAPRVTALKQVFYLRFLPDSDTCRISKQRPPSAAEQRHFQLLPQRRFCHFASLSLTHRGRYDVHRAVNVTCHGLLPSRRQKIAAAKHQEWRKRAVEILSENSICSARCR